MCDVHVIQAVDVSLNKLTKKLEKLKGDMDQLSRVEFMFRLPGGNSSDRQGENYSQLVMHHGKKSDILISDITTDTDGQ